MPGTATGKQNGKIHRKEMQKNMAYMKPDPNLDLNTTEGRREQLRQLLGSRAQKNSDPRGDIEVLQPQFIEYTDDDELVVEIPVRPWQVNGIDQVQGGVLAYMIDCVFGPLSFVTSGYNPVGTMDMTTNYLRPIVLTDNDRITIRARIITNSRRVMYAEAKLYNSAGKLAVTASTNIIKIGV